MPLIVMVAYGADRTSIVLWFVLPLVPWPYQYKDASAPYRQNLAPEKKKKNKTGALQLAMVLQTDTDRDQQW